MSITGPGELGRIDRQRIAQETAELLHKADNERDYREHVLVTLARMEVKQDVLQASFIEHVKDDNQRFAGVTQKIGDNSSWINKGIGMAVLFVVMVGVMMWLIDRATP